jgi:SRSO17 transposase
VERYLPLFYRKEQSANASIVIQGLLSDLERKTCEPIARRENLHRKPIQFFVGAGKWDDEAVMAEMRKHIASEIGDPGGILILDPSAFAKKGRASCGVKRQWCGRLGKVENCQVGVFLAYATNSDWAPLDRRLFLPRDWAADTVRRHKTHVPDEIVFSTKVELAAGMLAAHAPAIPHAWITGDDEFGRSAAFRAQLRHWGERYVLDVPSNTLIRDLQARRPPRRGTRGRAPEVRFVRAELWARRRPFSRWQRFRVKDGEKGPLEVLALETPVRARQEGRVGNMERLVVMRTCEENPRTHFALTNAGPEVPLAEIVRVQARRHAIEELFEAAKGEAGLAHYEVRSWVGWHHHMTLALLALWFLIRERCLLRKKNTRTHGTTNSAGLLTLAS